MTKSERYGQIALFGIAGSAAFAITSLTFAGAGYMLISAAYIALGAIWGGTGIASLRYSERLQHEADERELADLVDQLTRKMERRNELSLRRLAV